MRYALLAYSNIEVRDHTPQEERRRINAGIAGVVAGPNVTGWLRLQEAESATTVRHEPSRTLLTDGPFVDSKDFLGGVARRLPRRHRAGRGRRPGSVRDRCRTLAT